MENCARCLSTQHEHDNTVDSFENFLLLILKYVYIDLLFHCFVCDIKYIVNSPGTVNISTLDHPLETI